MTKQNFKKIITNLIRALVWPFQKLYLNLFLYKLNSYSPIQSFKKHGYIVASSWSGKSEFIKLLVYREIKKRKVSNSVIVIDPHGDLVEEIARLKILNKPRFSNRLVYIDPSLSQDHSPSINPFQLKIKSEKNISLMTQELKSIMTVLLQKATTTNQMDALLSPCIATLLRRPNSSFADLQRFMDDKNNSDLVELWKASPNPHHRSLFQHQFQSSLYSATKHGIYTRVQVLLNDPVFQNLISHRTSFELKKLINQKKIILFKLSLWESGSESVQSYGRFIVGWLRIIAFQRSSIPSQFRVPTYLIIDEFQNFISEDIEKALTQLRKYGLHLILSNQYVGQAVSSSLQKALFASWVKVVGKNDRKSLNVISNELDIPVSSLKNLRIWEFYIQSGIRRAIKVKTPKLLLKDNQAMPERDWWDFKNKNLKQYYLKLSDQTNPDIEKAQNWVGQFIAEDNLQNLSPKYSN